ncbi:hypothetical protein SAMN05443665_10348 [Actinomadura meyerae]|uniref:Uncharacterized protein n=2 Tax=Actinomadura meyerae TaxID=240840 RepID=A0A239MYQ1_9ACTN|nr:hypothetical protein SAMN05443665_10348 [Actinomadura meyerae]
MRNPMLGLLPAAVAAVAVTAVAVPASAEEAPQPAPQTYTLSDCPEALGFLTSLLSSLLKSPDVTRAVCSTRAEEDAKDAQDAQYAWDAWGEETAPLESTYTGRDGRTSVEENALLGLVEMPKNLVIKVPTLDEGLYTYTSGGR